MIKIVSAIACASLALLVPVAASAEDTKPIWASMENATTVYESKGFVATAWEKQGEAANGGHMDLVIRLDAGTEYSILALCGPACSNLDIQVLSPSGKVVAADAEADKIPIAGYKPASAAIIPSA